MGEASITKPGLKPDPNRSNKTALCSFSKPNSSISPDGRHVLEDEPLMVVKGSHAIRDSTASSVLTAMPKKDSDLLVRSFNNPAMLV